MATWAMLMVSCGSGDMKGYKKTSSGLYYRFELQNKDSQQVQEGDVLVGEMTIRLDSTVLRTNVGHSEQLMLAIPMYDGPLHEGLLMMHKGDRAIFAIEADSMANFMQSNQMPPTYKQSKGMKFYWEINLQDIVTSEAYAKAQSNIQTKIEKSHVEPIERERMEREQLEQNKYSWMNGVWHLSFSKNDPYAGNINFRITLKINTNNHSIELIDEDFGGGYSGTYIIDESSNIISCDGNCVHFDPNKQLFYERVDDEWGLKKKRVYYHKR